MRADAVGYEWTFIVVAITMTISLFSMAFVYQPTFDPKDFESPIEHIADEPISMVPYGSIRTTEVTQSRRAAGGFRSGYNRHSDSL